MTDPKRRARAYDGETFVVPDDGYARPEDSLSQRRCAVLIDAAVDARGVRFTILAQRSGAQGEGEWAT
jgi:hypothetical protein